MTVDAVLGLTHFTPDSFESETRRSPVKLPKNTSHPHGSRGQVSERREAESKRWERSDRVLLERISPNKAKTAPGDTGAPSVLCRFRRDSL